jgi:hypothetical protein
MLQSEQFIARAVHAQPMTDNEGLRREHSVEQLGTIIHPIS